MPTDLSNSEPLNTLPKVNFIQSRLHLILNMK